MVANALGFQQVLDVDSHEMIPVEFWGQFFDQAVAAEIDACDMKFLRENGENTLSRPEITDDDVVISDETVWTLKGPSAPSAIDLRRRPAALDQMGIARQLVFPTFGLLGTNLFYNPQAHKFLRYDPAGVDREGLGRRIIQAHNGWAATVTRETDERVRPVAIILPETLESMMKETERVLELGVRAVMLPISAPPADTSPADPALDVFWNLLAGTNTPVTIHVGTEFGFMASGNWSANAPAFKPLVDSSIELPFEPYRATTMHFGAENYLTTLVLGGVFERHPDLHFGAIELGASWIGPLADRLECWGRPFRKRFAETLSLSPSEYIARNVRVTPYFFEPVDAYIERYPSLVDVYCYSTDFPHLEGGQHSKQVFLDRLASSDAESISKFFCENGRCLIP